MEYYYVDETMEGELGKEFTSKHKTWKIPIEILWESEEKTPLLRGRYR